MATQKHKNGTGKTDLNLLFVEGMKQQEFVSFGATAEESSSLKKRQTTEQILLEKRLRAPPTLK